MEPLSYRDDLKHLLAGATRSLTVRTLTYPLEVVKIHQQDSRIEQSATAIARTIWREGGIGGFYCGFRKKVGMHLIKQTWQWPLIMRGEKRGAAGQLKTGLVIATINAASTLKLEQDRIRLITKKSGPFSWRGFGPYWLKLSVNWSTFLVSQKLLRDGYQKKVGRRLSAGELCAVGVATSLMTTGMTAPFDLYHTRRQSWEQATHLHLSLRGGRVQFLCRTVETIASVALIHWLGK